MRRAANFLLRNWPLKFGAILLATVLYSGLVLGQNVRTWSGVLPVDTLRPPTGATLLADLEPVTLIRYRAPLDVGVLSPDSFRATVDLSRAQAEPGGPPVSVPVTVIALDQRVQVVDFQPRELEIRLDPVATRQKPVTVTLGSVPEGLNVGPPQTEPGTVTVRGASSRVDAVSAIVARVGIDASALNIDREFDLVAVDANGNQVPNIEIDPGRARVRIAVARELANLTLPVVPQLTGTPAPGYRIASVTFAPLVVTVSGEEATVARLESAPTDPIDIDGRTTDLEAMVGLALPDGVSVIGSDQVRVVLTVERVNASATVLLPARLTGTQCACVYGYSLAAASVTLTGPADALAGIDGAPVALTFDISGLEPGTHQVALSVIPPTDLVVSAIDPALITVTIEAATPIPSP